MTSASLSVCLLNSARTSGSNEVSVFYLSWIYNDSVLKDIKGFSWFFCLLGDFVIVDPIKEGGKVKGEIRFILYKDHIQYLRKLGVW